MEHFDTFDRLIICNTKGKGERTMITTYERPEMDLAVLTQGKSREGKHHLSWRQRKVRPNIEDVICHLLDGAALKDALIFVDKIRAGGMKIKWTSVNTWSVTLKRKYVCEIKIEKDSWSVSYTSENANTNVNYIPYSPSRMRCKYEALKAVIAGTQRAYQASY